MEALIKWGPIILVAFTAIALAYVSLFKARVWKRKLTSEIITLNPATAKEA